MTNAKSLPFEISEAIVQACGAAFWLKDPLKALLVRAGVDGTEFERYREESKYKIVRHLLGDLAGKGEEGWLIQRKILTELCNLRDVPDPEVPDRTKAIYSLNELRKLATSHDLWVKEERSADQRRAQERAEKETARQERLRKMDELRSRFLELSARTSRPQARGYDLEDLLIELFTLHEVPYKRSYRTQAEQIDGHFEYKAFSYIVESRWRAEKPDQGDLADLGAKVGGKLTSTRGCFVSIVGFRPEALASFQRSQPNNIIYVDGDDLFLTLDGRISLTDALDYKIEMATARGEPYAPLRARF